MQAFFNGQLVPKEQATVSVFDRSFMYGDGLFETMRIFNGKPFRWAQHLERMQRGAQFLKIRMPFTPQELKQHARQLIEANQIPDGVLRVHLSRGVGERGYLPKGADQPVLLMSTHPAPTVDPANPPKWRLITSPYKVVAEDPLASFKTASRLLHVGAMLDAEAADADDALILNTMGEVVQTATANLQWVYRDTVYTVPTGRGALPGITRAVILEVCQAQNIPTNKRVIKPEALFKAEGVFVTLSTFGVVPVVSLDGNPLNECPIVEQVRQGYEQLLAKN